MTSSTQPPVRAGTSTQRSAAAESLPSGVGDEVFTRPGWWDVEDRAYAALRSLNELRLQLLTDWMQSHCGGWRGRTVVDLGCGGGLMAVPIARQGARVIALDYSLPALREGQAQGAGLANFVRADLRRCPIQSGRADLVVLSDVVEHVAEPGEVVAIAARLLRPGGHLFVNTINRTTRARLLAVTLGEGLGFIPRGTHDPRRFVRPEELAAMARAAGMSLMEQEGERPVIWRSLLRRRAVFRRGRSCAVGYCAVFRKEEER